MIVSLKATEFVLHIVYITFSLILYVENFSLVALNWHADSGGKRHVVFKLKNNTLHTPTGPPKGPPSVQKHLASKARIGILANRDVSSPRLDARRHGTPHPKTGCLSNPGNDDLLHVGRRQVIM